MSFSFGIDENYAAAVFGTQSQQTAEFLMNHARAAMSTLSGVGERLINSITNQIQYYSSSDYAVKASKLASELGQHVRDTIRELVTVDDFRNITPLMARYVTAMPHFREQYAKRLTSGYGDFVLNGEWAPLVHIEDPLAPLEQLTAYRRYADGDYVETNDSFKIGRAHV